MTYDVSETGQMPDALWVLQNRRGVCTEYSRLLLPSPARSGYPPADLDGYVYSQQFDSWMGHAWAEAYVGQWVPVDPTWLEAVRPLDAVHVEEAKYAESYKQMTLSTVVSSQGTDVQWSTNGNQTGAAVQNGMATNISYSAKQSGYYSRDSRARAGLRAAPRWCTSPCRAAATWSFR